MNPKEGLQILKEIWVSIYSPMTFESSKDFIVDCQFLM
jgi:hypothetical protein